MCFRKGKDDGGAGDGEKDVREDHVGLIGHCRDKGLYCEQNQSLEVLTRSTSDIYSDS